MQNKINNKIAAVALGVVLSVGLVSCEDYLDKAPKGELTSENFFKDELQATQAVNAIYSHLRNFNVHVFSYIGITDIASDDADKGSVPGDAGFLQDINDFTFDANNTAVNGIWSGYFQGVFRANQVIANVPEIDMDEELKSRLIGEARFLRAYFYFFLVRTYGDLPLIDRPLNPDEYTQARVSKEEIYEFIEEDFSFAAANLPEKSEYDASELGRATSGAAKSFLAKVHLFQNEYQEAYDLAQEVITSGEYELYPDYEGIFRREGEHSSESIFEVSTVALEAGGGGSQFNEVQGIRGNPNNGWGFNGPSDDLMAAYEENDPRLAATIINEGDTLPSGEVVMPDPNMGENARFSRKAWLPERPPSGFGNSGANIRIFRYADLLLIAAEAANEIGNSDQALEYVNMVRERARQGNEDILPDVTTTDQAELRDAIYHERRVELAMEQHRYFDLVRQGRAQEVFADLGITWTPGKHEVYPVPQSEIDISGGSITQNPGY
ncbi:RagB/SusD family nutrient uptake outer membrane protein [Algoriphagus halophytocola]|uniref:RagB/SusD family nutrient uptake outer membrane protein n=1 Tax=Algoriphagus halophytocola TaxID=2991499 RepID=A0ABY6MGZ7_9BACT|nr:MULTISPECIES: RagB/SusD family nutrient uptake outer membrane protein [unclassified Algoriphagus]UZD22923.1 RagB/SusD family nutrient uptake outer membrane protein [Algoriphagus sp. TR-M5]WBL44191.1 RagB/SusD family nutrient uptake outer membrane protein [Algoriphagus sp. TR-M9]